MSDRTPGHNLQDFIRSIIFISNLCGMADVFQIPVTHENQELTFKAHSMRFGYVNHILVEVNGTTVTIERDEEGNFRALVDPEKVKDAKVDFELVKCIVR